MNNSPRNAEYNSANNVTKIEGVKKAEHVSGVHRKATESHASKIADFNHVGETFTFSSLLYAPVNPVEREMLADSMIVENEPDDLILEIQSLIHSTL